MEFVKPNQFELNAKFNLTRIPSSPGIYFFVGQKNKVLYIGKAANLRERVRSYFSGTRSEKVLRLVAEAEKLKIEPLESEIAAFLEEAKWIKKIRPKYNILLRDDKNYFFVAITKEKFPRIFITHQPKDGAWRGAEFIGPFVNGRTLKKVLRLIRSYFSYCTCSKSHHRICLPAQLGLCSGYCCLSSQLLRAKSWEDESAQIQEYQSNIAKIKKILQGNITSLKQDLVKRIKAASKVQQFEIAAEYKKQIEGLERIMAHQGFIETFTVPEGAEAKTIKAEQELAELVGIEDISRIEMYDASMISGVNAVGAMVVFEKGKPVKSEYRLFRIRNAGTQNDPAMIAEIIQRRLRHAEWSLPDIILVDGGRTQLEAARKVIKDLSLTLPTFVPQKLGGRDIPVASLVKGAKHETDRLFFGARPVSKKVDSFSQELRTLLTSMQSEVHRFAVAYHRKRRKMQLLT